MLSTYRLPREPNCSGCGHYMGQHSLAGCMVPAPINASYADPYYRRTIRCPCMVPGPWPRPFTTDNTTDDTTTEGDAPMVDLGPLNEETPPSESPNQDCALVYEFDTQPTTNIATIVRDSLQELVKVLNSNMPYTNDPRDRSKYLVPEVSVTPRIRKEGIAGYHVMFVWHIVKGGESVWA